MSFQTSLLSFKKSNLFKKIKQTVWIIFFIGLMPALAFADGAAMTTMLSQTPTLSGFDICYGGGCAVISRVSLSDMDWQNIVKMFEPLPQNAVEERADIAKSIAVFEQIVGSKTGTSEDKGGTFGNSAYPNQLDCNDEAANTTIYMRLLKQANYLHFHQIIDTKTRGYFLNGWPHSTAAIQEITTGEKFAVDSWFYDNGKPATIVPLALWKSGWKPEKTSAH